MENAVLGVISGVVVIGIIFYLLIGEEVLEKIVNHRKDTQERKFEHDEKMKQLEIDKIREERKLLEAQHNDNRLSLLKQTD